MALEGGMTHLQPLQISMKFLLDVASDIGRMNVWKLKTFQFRNKKQK